MTVGTARWRGITDGRYLPHRMQWRVTLPTSRLDYWDRSGRHMPHWRPRGRYRPTC
jgi:hypothetical protein